MYPVYLMYDICTQMKKTLTKGHFTLGVRTKETQKLRNSIGGELKIGPKGFILGVKTNVYKND
jgi:hypothetical protein